MGLRTATNGMAIIALAMLAVSCTANVESSSTSSDSTSGSYNASDSSLMSARVLFDFEDFYSLTSPNEAGCAGDVKNLYDPLVSRDIASDPEALTSSGGSYGGTYRPAFIKNISVDISDSNSTASSNLAGNCAEPVGPSACATFDYGANTGVTSSLAGSMLLIGGIQNTNYSGINGSVTNDGLAVSCGPANGTFATSCGTSLFAVGVDSLPASAATDPPNALVPGLDSASGNITGFVNLASSSSFSGPQDFMGAAGAYDSGEGELAIFGGSSVIGASSAAGESADNDNTWLYDVSTQSWTQIATDPQVATDLEETFEQITTGTSEELSNIVTGRANFGYAAAQGLAVDEMSTGGTMPVYSTTGPVDSTDRIIVAGGEQSSGFLADSYQFNPTYGPNWVDTQGRSVSAAAAGEETQWLVSYPTVPLFNTSTAAEMKPEYYGASSGVLSTNFGFASVRDNNASDYGAGYPLFVGGFDTSQATGVNPHTNSCDGASGSNCGMMIGARTGRGLDVTGSGSSEQDTSNFLSVGNLLESFVDLGIGTDTQLTPVNWSIYTDSGSSSVPWYGGSTLLPGFNLDTNDLVFFGGSTCESYLLSSASGCSFANPGVYYSLGTDPVNNGGVTTVPSTTATAGSAPQRAGMAAARGTDGSGNPLIVAFGGMSAAGTGTDTAVYYLWDNGGVPTWSSSTPAGTGPNVPTNGALVFSHVTKKFYLFGGYASATGTMQGDTWALTVSPSNCGTAGSCTFTWTQLNITGGTSCSPTCPQARRSHRMVEVNYANQNPGGTQGGVTSGESTCSSTAPCSYGIFMEGGTSDGTTILDDRWMFDPTANYNPTLGMGAGAWVELHEMPARTLSAMASTDYTIASSNHTVHRAVLFGGEMGMANPSQAANSQYYVPPTLGDTWMYDYDNNTWNRVQLLGAGYNGLATTTYYQSSELANRQAYDATDGTGSGDVKTDQREVASLDGGVTYINYASELSPPPTSGQIMITRTLNGPSTSGGTALAIPEVYMVGGRRKDGVFQSFDHVYKFCAGSTGESYSNASPGLPNDGTHAAFDSTCDAYNSSSNSFSPSPSSSYIGRWLRKAPSSGSGFSSFMGAGAYDSANDLLVVFGGLQDTSSGDAVTSASRTISSNVYQYTFPSSGATQGSWASRGVCAGSLTPTARYGHSMVYNTQLGALVIVGGYDINGNPLTETVSGASGSFQIPDMWEGKYDSTDTCYNWTQITTIGDPLSGPQAASPNGLSHMIAVYVPPSGYLSGYYSTYDSACSGVGPIKSDDPTQSKLLAGGAYFDIDRTQLGPNENLLLNLTFMPLDSTNTAPDGSSLPTSSQAYFKIHLIKTGLSAQQIEETDQPRYLTYTNDQTDYPETVQTLSVLAPPTGQIQQQQILIPLTANSDIDRIRIERYEGNAILIDAALYRMGYK